MRLTVMLVMAAILATFDHAAWPPAWPAPALAVAFMAWVLVAGDANHALWRCWLLGVVTDLTDPGSSYFHAVGFLALAVAYLPMRRFVHPRSLVGAILVALVAALALAGADRLLTGTLKMPGLLIPAVLTALVTPLLGLFCEAMPDPFRPLRLGEGALLR